MEDKMFKEHKSLLNNFNKELENYKEKFEKEVLEFKKIENSFDTKVEDFFDKERKLRLAVVGQVKSGKSTFLNNLLFDGQDILPRAATPKTATLTVIKYSRTNKIEAEFYSDDEWKEILRLSKMDGDADEIKVARETVNMIYRREIDYTRYIGAGLLVKEYSSYEELLGELNEYAGEDGGLTPMVKTLTFYVNQDSIKDIEIIDTPGLNDPIVSRTLKTREYIGKCDVVFFLSQAPSFLDSVDMELLGRQLPQDGINKMILLGSKYDSAILDVIWDVDSIEEAEIEVKTSLKGVAKRSFEKYIDDIKKKNKHSKVSDILVKVIEDAKDPMFVSSMAYNMSRKTVDEYSKEEKNIYEGLCENEEVTSLDLKRIGNFDEVYSEFEEVTKEKKNILKEKANVFLPTLKLEFINRLNGTKAKISKRIEILTRDDLEALKREKRNIELKQHGISLDVQTIFGKWEKDLEREKSDAVNSIRELIRDYSSVEEKTAEEVRTTSKDVSISKWYNPFSWGKSETIKSNYTEIYSYLEAADIAENLRNYSNESVNRVEKVFNNAVDFSSTKQQLLIAIVNNFDTSSDMFDPGYFKLIVERTLNEIEIPVIEIDIEKQLQYLLSNFTGRIKDDAIKVGLKIELSKTIGNIFEALNYELLKEISEFDEKVKILKSELTQLLILDISSELDIIISEFENRENELESNKELEKIISSYQIEG